MHFVFLMFLPLSCISSRALLSPGAQRGILEKAGVEGDSVRLCLSPPISRTLCSSWDSTGGLGQSLLSHRPACYVTAWGTISPVWYCQKCSSVCHLCAKVISHPGLAGQGCGLLESSSGSLCTQGCHTAWAGGAVISGIPSPRSLLHAVLDGDRSPSHPLRKLLPVNPQWKSWHS